MYKMLIFIKKSDNPDILKHFSNFTIPILNEISGKEIKPARVESSLLIDQKYTWFCEVSVDSRDEWNRLMANANGKKLNKDLMDIHQSIDLIFVNDEEDL